MHDAIAERVWLFNKERIPDFLQLKFKAMAENSFRFYRGSCHLFYEDLPKQDFLYKSPPAWICGDLHLENFGSYKGDNRLTYFDINDFDEAILAPCIWDVTRFLCSVFMAAEILRINFRQSVYLANTFIDAYAEALSQGYIRVLEEETATGVVKDFLTAVKNRKRKDYLSKHVILKKHRLRLIIDELKTKKTDKQLKEQLRLAFRHWSKGTDNPDFYEVKDIAWRIAGTASLGLERYVVLIEGRGAPFQHFLLDVKQERSSCLLPYTPYRQPPWENEVARVIEVQKRVQANSPALLNDFLFGAKHFVLRELQPAEDKIDFGLFAGKMKKFGQFLAVMGKICAWGQLRSSGRQGSAIADELIAYGNKADHWRRSIQDYAHDYAKKAKEDYRQYLKDFRKGYFEKKLKG